MKTKCPVCNTWASGKDAISAIFGFRLIFGIAFPQSYCRRCRLIQIKKSNSISLAKYCVICYSKLKQRRNLYCQYPPSCRSKFLKLKRSMTPHLPKPIIAIKEIDILEGLTESQKGIIRFFVSHGAQPLGFDVFVKENRITYFGREINQFLKKKLTAIYK